MLKRLGEETVNPSVNISEANFPAPFVSGLEYGAPARGTWNIVHVGMLIPGAHQIFVCAQGCLRGVVLTAAEMGASNRFSTISIQEHNVLDGDMEDLIIDGVTDILERLPAYPPAVLIYTSCIHHFMGSDLHYVYKELQERYPQIAFTDCYMNPIMRKSGMTPDQTMRRQLYSLLSPRPHASKTIHIAGCDFRLDRNSELGECLTDNGFSLREVASAHTYEEYLALAECEYSITTFPAAKAAGDYLEKNFGQKHLYLPSSFDYDVIDQNLKMLQETLGCSYALDTDTRRSECDSALKKVKELIGDAEITIDFTAFPQMLSLAKLLITQGFNVTRLYTDNFLAEEKEIFHWLQEHAPELKIYPTVHASMRIQPRQSRKKILAIGQKAAYFSGTDHFVNVVEGAGLWGYEAVIKLTDLMIEAWETRKDTKGLIQIKGMGCGNCS